VDRPVTAAELLTAWGAVHRALLRLQEARSEKQRCEDRLEFLRGKLVKRLGLAEPRRLDCAPHRYAYELLRLLSLDALLSRKGCCSRLPRKGRPTRRGRSSGTTTTGS
jgi:hypothetical protein